MSTENHDQKPTPLSSLEDHADFQRRHIGPGQAEIDKMLAVIGEGSLDELIRDTLPASILIDQPLNLADSRSEEETLRQLREMANRNIVNHSLIGLGYHDTITPPVILRNILENPGWYTAYTPYQAEISQGRLEALLNFQHMVCDLTGMELANASLLDEATAAAEAMAMLHRVNRKSRSDRFGVDDKTLPQTLDVLRTRARHLGIELLIGEPEDLLAQGDLFGLLLQYPGANGEIREPGAVIESAHSANTLVAVAADLLSLVVLKPPGEFDADVVLGSAQRFGVPMGFGGPHAAFFATRDAYKRSIPGRVIGISRDRHDEPALRMALQTREQHIRRDKATSNICTAQALLAVMAGAYAVYHGADGLRRIAGRVHRLTCLLVAGLEKLGVRPQESHWFDTVTFRLSEDTAAEINQRALTDGINVRSGAGGLIGISINERTSKMHITALWAAFAGNADTPDFDQLDRELGDGLNAIPASLQRQTDFLDHPVFQRHHSETEMLRYLKRLENRDLSLAHSMISLGSCTMKLNATTEMIPVTWPEFCDIHPFAPPDQWQGYRHRL
jgi:glycine dehydrogenase